MMKDYKFNCYHSESLLKEILDDEYLKKGVLKKNTIIESNLVSYSVNEIIESLDSLSKKLIKNKKAISLISQNDLGFLIAFLTSSKSWKVSGSGVSSVVCAFSSNESESNSNKRGGC